MEKYLEMLLSYKIRQTDVSWSLRTRRTQPLRMSSGGCRSQRQSGQRPMPTESARGDLQGIPRHYKRNVVLVRHSASRVRSSLGEP